MMMHLCNYAYDDNLFRQIAERRVLRGSCESAKGRFIICTDDDFAAYDDALMQ